MSTKATVLAATIWVGVVVVGSMAVAQPGDLDIDDIDLGGGDDELAALRSNISLIGDIRSAEQAADEAGEDPESGLPRNIVFEAVDAVDSPEELGVGSRSVVDCLNPPDDYRATYSVGITEHETEIQRRGLDTTRVELDIEAYSKEVIDRHAPPPDYDDKPQVRLAFNLGDGEWAWSLADHWGDTDKAEEYLRRGLPTVSSRLHQHSVGGEVCEVVDHFEEVLAELETRPRVYFERRAVEEQLEYVEGLLDDNVETMEQIGGLAPDEREVFEEPAGEVRDHLEAAYEALDDRDFDQAREYEQQAREAMGSVNYRVDTFESADETAEELDERMEEHREGLGLRRADWVPEGEATAEKFEAARQAVDELQEGVLEDRGWSEIEDLEERAGESVGDFEAHLEETTGVYRLAVLGIPVGIIIVVTVGWTKIQSRRSRKQEQIEARVRDRIQQWETDLQRIDPRVRTMRAELMEMIEEDRQRVVEVLDDEQCEAIDLVFVLAGEARQIGSELQRRFAGGTDPETTFDQIERYLRDRRLEVGPDDSASATVLQPRLGQTYRFDRRELLDRLDELVGEARGYLREASQQLDEEPSSAGESGDDAEADSDEAEDDNTELVW